MKTIPDLFSRIVGETEKIIVGKTQQIQLISPAQCQNEYASLQLALHHFGSLWAFVFCLILMTSLFGKVRREQQRPVKRRKLSSFSGVVIRDFPGVRILKSV